MKAMAEDFDIVAMKSIVQRISAGDDGDFARWFVRGTLEEIGHQDMVESTDAIVALLRYHMVHIPEMFQLMSGREDVASFLVDAERAVLATEDEEGLYGLLFHLWSVGSALRWCRDQGMTLPEGLAIDTAIELSGILLGEEHVARLQRRLDIAGLGSGFDERLLGSWHHSRHYSSDDFSHVSTTSRFFGRDGRYVEGSQSFVSMVHRSSTGEMIGQDLEQGVPAAERGRWKAKGNTLELEADNGWRWRLAMEVYPRSMLLTAPGREPELWKR